MQSYAFEAFQNSIDSLFQSGYFLQDNLQVGATWIVRRHSSVEQTSKTANGGQGVPNLVGDAQRHVVQDLNSFCEYQLIFQMLSGSDVKDEAVDALSPVVLGNWDGVVNDMTHRLITVDNSVFQGKTVALFQVKFSAEANSLPIFGMDMVVPEKIVFLNFLVTVAKDFQAIRADVEGAQMVVQTVGHYGRIFK